MKNKELQLSLIKSGIILAVCIFLIYAFAANDSGGISGTIASLFSGALFLVGLSFALIVSVIVLFAIYFSILYMYDKDTCKKTYVEFKQKLSTSCDFPCCSSGGDTDTPVTALVATEAIGEEDLTPLRNKQDDIDAQLAKIKETVTSIEATLTAVSSTVNDVTEQMKTFQEKASAIEENLESKATVDSVEESVKRLSGEISALQGTIAPLNDKITELENAVAASDDSSKADKGDEIQALIDSAVNSVQKKLDAVKATVKDLAAKPKATTAAPEGTSDATEDDGPHRILSYFSKKNDEKKFVSLVKKAVSQKMTYAQAGEFLSDSLSAAAAEVIDDHPSLTKDYIKSVKQAS